MKEQVEVEPLGARILVVDDDELQRLYFTKLLSSRGYNVCCVEDGTAALARLECEQFDLLLLDVIMPGPSGTEVLQKIRERYSLSELPVILATVQDDRDHVVRGLRLGASDYVIKPVDSEILHARIETQLKVKFLSELKDELFAMQEQLRQAQKMEALEHMAGGVAHNFNNLLSIIVGYAKLLEHAGPAHERREFVEAIVSTVSRGKALVDQLMAFSSTNDSSPVVLDPRGHVENLVRVLGSTLHENIHIRTAMHASSCMRMDPHHLDQIMVNLAMNAQDAMPGGGRLVITSQDVTVASGTDSMLSGDYVLLTVTDSGRGMDELTASRIFEPFFTTKRDGCGRGLGLSLVYGLVTRNHGSIRVRSVPGEGTAFSMYFPAVMVYPTVESHRAPKPSLTLRRHAAETVLLVEDEEALRHMLARFLRSSGYQVLEACSADNALLLCLQHKGPIQVAVTDVIMPGMNGYEFCRRLHEIRPEARVVFMTGYVDHELCRSLSLAEQPLLRKPFMPEDLVESVRKLLSESQTENVGAVAT